MLGHAPLGGAPLGAPGSSAGAPPQPTAVDGARVTDAPAGALRISPVAADGATVTDAAVALVSSLNQVIVDGITAQDVPAGQLRVGVALIDGIRVGDTLMNSVPVLLAETLLFTDTALSPVPSVDASMVDGIKLLDVATVSPLYLVTLAETVKVADALAYLSGVSVVETLRLPSTLTAQAEFNVFATELVRLADQVRNGVAVSLTEAITLTSTLSPQTAVQLLDGVRLASQLGGGATFGVQIAERLQLADSLANFFGVSITDAVGVADLMTALRVTSNTLVDGVTVGDTGSTATLMMAITLADGVNITDEQAVAMLFNGQLADGVDISGGYLDPSGSFTAWNMNTRTGAVTEYGNYAFNSFAAIGNLYVGASEDGLFELLGDDDGGQPIIATLQGGYMQFGGTQLSRMKEAYIAAFGEGHWVLKIVTGDNYTYTYEVDNRTGRNTKFHMGKGQRARYFSWNLTSAGQDFDLDTLEFVPLVVQRRV